MPLFEENQSTNSSFQLNNQVQNKGIFSLPPAVMNIVPWIPLMLEMTTGQKIPQMTGTIGEIQQGIQTIQMTLGQIIQQQQSLDQRLIQLGTNASQQFTNLTNQFKSLRLTHTKEQRQIELQSNPHREEENPEY